MNSSSQSQTPTLTRSSRYARLGGVCSGIAQSRGYSILLTRIVTLLLATLSGIGILAYILGWIFIPLRSEASEPSASNDPLKRTMGDKKIGGVCGGIARLLNADPALVRIVFALFLITGGAGLIPYLYAWYMMPSDTEGPLSL